MSISLIEGLNESANWSNYSLLTQNEEDMQRGYTSPMQYDNVKKPDPLAIVPVPLDDYSYC